MTLREFLQSVVLEIEANPRLLDLSIVTLKWNSHREEHQHSYIDIWYEEDDEIVLD